MLGYSLNISLCRNEYDGTGVSSRYAPLLSQRHKTKHTKPKPAVEYLMQTMARTQQLPAPRLSPPAIWHVYTKSEVAYRCGNRSELQT